jgi:hypothetical protein
MTPNSIFLFNFSKIRKRRTSGSNIKKTHKNSESIAISFSIEAGLRDIKYAIFQLSSS